MKYNKIYVGDSLLALRDVSRFMSESVDLIITSPPYGWKRKHAYGGTKPKDYLNWFLPISEQLLRILKPKGSFILNIKEGCSSGERETYVLELVLALKEQGWHWIEEYCWYKKNSFPGKWKNRFRDSWERCYHFTKKKEFKMYQDSVKVPIGNWSKGRFRSMGENDFIRNISGTNSRLGRNVANWLNRRKVYPHNVLDFEKEHYEEVGNVLHFPTVCNNLGHSAAFPIELPTWFIRLFTKKGDIVMDPFIGTGTSAVAAKLLGRNYLGIEIVGEYAKTARKRVQEADKLWVNTKL